jgi:hypothetical protein
MSSVVYTPMAKRLLQRPDFRFKKPRLLHTTPIYYKEEKIDDKTWKVFIKDVLPSFDELMDEFRQNMDQIQNYDALFGGLMKSFHCGDYENPWNSDFEYYSRMVYENFYSALHVQINGCFRQKPSSIPLDIWIIIIKIAVWQPIPTRFASLARTNHLITVGEMSYYRPLMMDMMIAVYMFGKLEWGSKTQPPDSFQMVHAYVANLIVGGYGVKGLYFAYEDDLFGLPKYMPDNASLDDYFVIASHAVIERELMTPEETKIVGHLGQIIFDHSLWSGSLSNKQSLIEMIWACTLEARHICK